MSLFQGFLHGRRVIDVTSDDLTVSTTKPDQSTSVDRVVLTLPTRGRAKAPLCLVLDVIPASSDGYPGGSTIAFTSTASPRRLDFQLVVRILICDCNCSRALLKGTLTTDVSGKIVIASLILDGVSLLPSAGVRWEEITKRQLEQQWPLPISDAGRVPLYYAVGLKSRPPTGALSKISFAETEAGSGILVPTISYRFALRHNTPASIRLTNLSLDWTAEEIGVAGLVQVGASSDDYKSAPGTARQALYLDPLELQDATVSTPGKWLVSLDGFPSRAVIAAWNEFVADPFLRSLHGLSAGQPVTGMPWFTQVDVLTPTRSTGDAQMAAYSQTTLQARLLWEIGLSVVDSTAGEFPLTPDLFQARGLAVIPPLALSLAWLRPMEPKAGLSTGVPQLPVVATLPGCQTHTGQPVQLLASIEPVEVNPTKVYGFAFTTRWQTNASQAAPSAEADPDNRQYVRIGSLEVVLPPSPSEAAPVSRQPYDPFQRPALEPLSQLYFARILSSLRPPDIVYSQLPTFINPEQPKLVPNSQFIVSFNGFPTGPGGVAAALSVNLSTVLPVLAVAPGGQDPMLDETFLSVGSGAPGQTDALLSDRRFSSSFYREPALLVGDHRLQRSPPFAPSLYLALAETSQATSSELVVIELKLNSLVRAEILRDLQRVRELMVVDRQPLLVSKVTAPIVDGALDEDAQQLAIWDSQGAFGFRWRLRSDSPDLRIRLPPQALGEQMEKSLGNIAANQILDFRFGPATQLQLRASEDVGRFVVVPWNVRRIFGGAESESATLAAAELELLYGMALRIVQPGLRIAEIQRLQGTFPQEFAAELPWNAVDSQARAYLQVRGNWADVYRRLSSRLGLLEPWLDREQEELSLSGTDSVLYRLRANADLKYPIEGATPGTGSRAPNNPDGLAGGVAWGFPFASVYDQVWGNPVSDFGVINRPYFSALGGWGNQKASFAKETVKILSDTAMGRTFFYSLEIIGRIGVFKNRAKHVIIYRRTVAPTEQFQNEQDQLLGRPILRKVEEFVEILVPVAKFGDASATDFDKRARGCLRGIQFKTIRIYVDSKWGGDVFDSNHEALGYQIPLWNRVANFLEPEVYPRPQVLLELAADPASGSDSFLLAIANPENLRFFHSSRTDANGETLDGADTDAWPLFEGIDFLMGLPPAPDPTKEGTDFSSRPKLSSKPGFTLPPAIANGFESFTLHLDETDRKSNLMADRTSKVVGSVIRTILAARPIPPKIPTRHSLAETISDLQGRTDSLALGTLTTAVSNSLSAIGGIVPTGTAPTEDLRSQLLNRLIFNNATATTDDSLTAALAPVVPQLRRLDQLRQDLADLCRDGSTVKDNFVRRFDDGVADVAAIVNRGPSLASVKEAALQAVYEAASAAKVRLSLSGALREFVELREHVHQLKMHLDTAATQLATTWQQYLLSLQRALDSGLQDSITTREQCVRDIDGLLDDCQATIDTLGGLYKSLYGVFLETAPSDPFAPGSAIEAALGNFRNNVAGAAKAISFVDLKNDLQNAVSTYLAPLTLTIGNLTTLVDANLLALRTALDLVNSSTVGLAETWRSGLVSAIPLAADARAVVAVLQNAPQDLRNALDAQLRKQLVTSALPQLPSILKTVLKDSNSTKVAAVIEPLINLANDLNSSPWATVADVDNFRTAFGLVPILGTDFTDVVNVAKVAIKAAKDLSDAIRNGTAKLAEPTDTALRLLRAFGDVPAVPGLDFAGSQLGYYFDAAQQFVNTSPVMALVGGAQADLFDAASTVLNGAQSGVAQINDQLNALGVRLPISQLADGLVPNLDKQFFATPGATDWLPDISDMFPDFGGLKLDKLFSGMTIPDGLKDHLKVSHGIDPQTLRAWIKVDVVFDLGDPAEVFSFGPLTVTLNSAHFESHSSLQADVAGHFTKTTTGFIKGDWLLNVSSLDVVTLVDTQLTFDQSGKIKVDIEPQKIQLNSLLQVISDAVDAASGDSDGGFSYHLLQQGGMPIGVEVLLDLELPPIQEGTTGISNLHLMTSFELVAAPDFAIGIKFGLGTPDEPFTFTVFILGGAGAIIVGARYYPFSGRIAAYVSITLAASASLAISFGPINGFVAVYLGFEAEFYHNLSGGDASDNKLLLTAFLELMGEVDLAGIISVFLEVRLSLTYDKAVGHLTGTGTVSISIKICWCFTLDISESISMTLAPPGGRTSSSALTAAAAPNYQQMAAEHVGMYE